MPDTGRSDERPDSIPATTTPQFGAVYDVGAALALHFPDTHPCGSNRSDPWLILHQDGGIEWAASLREGARFLGVLPGVVGAIPVLHGELDFSALADACEEYVRAYRGSDEPDLPELVEAITKALGRPAKPTVDGDPHNGDTCQQVEHECEDQRGDINRVLHLLARRGFAVDSQRPLIENVRPALLPSPAQSVDGDLRERIVTMLDEMVSEYIHPNEFGGYDANAAEIADVVLAVMQPEINTLKQRNNALNDVIDKRDEVIGELRAELERERELKAQVLDTDTIAITSLNSQIDQLTRERDEAAKKMLAVHSVGTKFLGHVRDAARQYNELLESTPDEMLEVGLADLSSRPAIPADAVNLLVHAAESCPPGPNHAEWLAWGFRRFFKKWGLSVSAPAVGPDTGFEPTLGEVTEQRAAAEPKLEELRAQLCDWAAILARGTGVVPAVDVAWKLRQIAGGNNPAPAVGSDTTAGRKVVGNHFGIDIVADPAVPPGKFGLRPKTARPVSSGGDTDTTDGTWRAGDLALDRTDFVWWRDAHGWRPIMRLPGSCVSDRDFGRFLGPLAKLAGLPPEMNTVGSVPAEVAARLRVVPAEQEGGKP